jgi:hypothetical protein
VRGGFRNERTRTECFDRAECHTEFGLPPNVLGVYAGKAVHLTTLVLGGPAPRPGPYKVTLLPFDACGRSEEDLLPSPPAGPRLGRLPVTSVMTSRRS